MFGDATGWGAESSGLATLVEQVDVPAAREPGASRDDETGVGGTGPGSGLLAVTIFAGACGWLGHDRSPLSCASWPGGLGLVLKPSVPAWV